MQILRRYLHAYTVILRKRRFHYEYIDAFAGPGTFQVRGVEGGLLGLGDAQEADEAREFIAGSPCVALDIQHPFKHYYFIETNEDRLAFLREIKRSRPDRKITIAPRDCRDWLEMHFFNPTRWQHRRALVFLDPFGMQIHWDVLELLAATQAVEVFINFPAWMAVQRLMPCSGDWQQNPGWLEKLDTFFGTRDWYELMYSSSEQSNLLGDTDTIVHKSGTTDVLVSWYRSRLENLFGYASRASIVRGSKNQPLYCLIHAGPNSTGSRIANDILRSFGDWID